MADLSLTEDQEAALQGLTGFITAGEPFMVLEGFSGTGKSTLTGEFLKKLPSILKTRKLLLPRASEYMDVEFTATTNKAAESLRAASGQDVLTIYSYLKLRVNTDFSTGKTTIQGNKYGAINDTLLIIDEASFIDQELLDILETRINNGSNSAVLFIGDPAQLVQMKTKSAPVFRRNYPTVRLTQVVRQAEGNPIVNLSADLRDVLTTGQFKQICPDNDKIQTLTHEQAEAHITAAFQKNDKDVRVLAWRNKTVVAYNNMIRNFLHGTKLFKRNDRAIVNSFVHSDPALKNDQDVLIKEVSKNITRLGVPGNEYLIDRKWFFCPDDFKEHARLLKLARAEGEKDVIEELMTEWVDLRSPCAITVNKSQGSTYDEVYVDLSDITACRQGDTIARLLYVAVSRARERVYLIGDAV